MKNILSEKEMGYLCGLFEGDGYKIYDKKSRHYQIEFHLNSEKDKDIIKHLTDLLRKEGLNPLFYQDKRYNCKRVRVYSKELFELISKNLDLSGRTDEFLTGFVSGMIDSERHVNKEKSYIMIINTNHKVLEKCKKFLTKKGINSEINQRKKGSKDKLISYRMYVSVKFKNEPHLSMKVERLQK